MTNKTACFCCSQQPFAHCCEPLLVGTKQADTAEQLMRSRFSAFCSGNIPYLLASHHPSMRQVNDEQDLAGTIEQCQWLTLKIESTKMGSSTDTEGEVEYIATYTQPGPDGQPSLSQLHEKSRFVRENHHWFYLDGDVFDSPAPTKPGRNAPCWCGSGKKYKKCHA